MMSIKPSTRTDLVPASLREYCAEGSGWRWRVAYSRPTAPTVGLQNHRRYGTKVTTHQSRLLFILGCSPSSACAAILVHLAAWSHEWSQPSFCILFAWRLHGPGVATGDTGMVFHTREICYQTPETTFTRHRGWSSYCGE